MNILGIIPARYASTRFPGKPLALIHGTPMIWRVYERVAAMPFINHVVVATDDTRILHTVQQRGGHAVMTAATHHSGTDRCGEVLSQMGAEAHRYDVVINIQGDEPFVDTTQLSLLADTFRNAPLTAIATLKKQITHEEELLSPNVVKVVCDRHNKALYFSRQPIPHLRNVPTDQWLASHTHYKHVGIYAFRIQTLSEVVRLPQSPLEKWESLEQLRWIENGYTITVRETTVENISVDTPEDLQKLINIERT